MTTQIDLDAINDAGDFDYSCHDCGIDVQDIGEYTYMVHRHVWDQATKRARTIRGPGQVSTYDIVCIGCLQKRLGRELHHEDFAWELPLNTVTDMGDRSVRLRMAMAGGPG